MRRGSLFWVEFFNLPSTAHLGQKIEILSEAGKDTTKAITDISASHNPDGGFGGKAGYPSNALDTAFALQGLASSGSADATIKNQAASYLISAQNTDGGWGFVKGDISRVYYTALVMQALEAQPKTTSVANSLSKATTYIISQQQANGSWGNVAETALAYQALTRSTLDLASRNAAISYLTSTQLPDGSWNEDPYSTALALRALSDSGIISSAQINPTNLTKVIDGISQSASTYSAYETMTIGVTTADPDAHLEVTVQDSTGTVYTTSTENGAYFFDTQNLAPGTYTIIVIATDQNTGIIIDEETSTFTIEATYAISGIALGVIPTSTHIGASENITVSLSLTNRSNIQVSLTIEHNIKDPSGAIINSGTTSLSLSPDMTSAAATLSTFSHTFTASGEYPIQAKVLNQTTLLSTANTSISSAPAIRIDPTITLTPTTVTPDGDKRIRIKIHLEGVEKTP